MSQIRVRETPKRASVVVSVPPLVKKSSKSRSFHFRYLELCRAKNLTPVPNLRANVNEFNILELYGDKVGVSDWLLIIEALQHDLVLQTLFLRMRRSNGNYPVQPIDTEKRARLFRQKPVIYTRFIFYSLVQAISNCIQVNKNLTILRLEGLPLQDCYIELVAKSLASNDCLKEISFQRSYIGDKGCELVCSTVKYLNHVEIFNIGECNIGSKGAEYVADMIKMQKISRFSEGWEKSLRYRSVDINSISGLRYISLANNPNVGDDGIRPIAEVLKEDAWVKCIDLECCGLTDRGANILLDCLSLNNAITDLNISKNEGMSKILARQIRDQLGKEDEEKQQEPQYDFSCINGLQSLPKGQKFTISQLLTHTKTLEEQLSFERTLRKKAEKLNEKLNQQLIYLEQSMTQLPTSATSTAVAPNLPNGYVLVKNDSLQSVIKNTHYAKLPPNSAVSSAETTPRDIPTMRKQQLQQQQQQQQFGAPEIQSQTLRQANYEESDEGYSMMGADQQPRQPLQVRKVRSEMKYVEAMTKDNAKKRESKSDHEFANERDFKLNPNVEFEQDIGDGAMMQSNRKRYENAGDGDMETNYSNEQYERELMQAHNNMGYEHIGDGLGHEQHVKLSKMQKRFANMKNNQMGIYMAELEHKINGKSGKKRHKSKNTDKQDNHVYESPTEANRIQIDSYMSNMDNGPIDNTGGDSDAEVSTLRGQVCNTFANSPMNVFVRRTHSEMDTLEVQEDNSDTSEDQMISPRAKFMEMQRKKNEMTH
ncbi:CG7886 [Drosophila busckii]|uniref:CG7886 n=1 Tax=Drosophila busckii TaxID=30019 RepID=A0A0M4F290_DROBS|nr:protein Cep78 homolog [Drosophila busckii]ALC45512.1 CG7886 [Drosophila busckii]